MEENELQAAFTTVEKHHTIGECISVYKVLIRMSINIIENQEDIKYRKIKKDNAAAKKRLLNFQGVSSLLKSIGFEESELYWKFIKENNDKLILAISNLKERIAFLEEKDSSSTFLEEWEVVGESNFEPDQERKDSEKSDITPDIIVPQSSSSTSSDVPVASPATSFTSRRLRKELTDLREKSTEYFSLQSVEGNQWYLNIKGAPDTLYDGEQFTLRFTFSEKYPIESPEVLFIGNSPEHPHIYSNGHICLSILYDHWSPALGVSAVCVSIISMLSSCRRKQRPPDDGAYCHIVGNRASPKYMPWFFHDDSI